MAGRPSPELLAAEGGAVLVERTQAELTGAQHTPRVTCQLALPGLRQPAERPLGTGGRAAVGRRLGEPVGRESGRTSRPDPARQTCTDEESLRQLGRTSLAHPRDDALGPSHERGGWLTGAVPGGDREEVGLQPMDVPGLCAQQRRALVGSRHGTVPVVRGQGRTGNRHQEVRLLARLQRSGDESGLDDGEGVLGEPPGQVGSHLVEDEVDVRRAARVEERGRCGVLLERARQVAAKEGQPPGVVIGDGDTGQVAEGGRDLAESRERLGR